MHMEPQILFPQPTPLPFMVHKLVARTLGTAQPNPQSPPSNSHSNSPQNFISNRPPNSALFHSPIQTSNSPQSAQKISPPKFLPTHAKPKKTLKITKENKFKLPNPAIPLACKRNISWPTQNPILLNIENKSPFLAFSLVFF